MLTARRAGSGPRIPETSRLHHPLTTVLVVAAAFVAVFGLRISFYDPDDGIGLLYAIPVTIAAIRFGPWVGAACGAVAFGLFVVWTFRSPSDDVVFMAYVSRCIVFVTVGALVGYFARARAEVDVRSRRLLDLSPDLMATLDDRGRLVTSNAAWDDAARRLSDAEPAGAPTVVQRGPGDVVTASEQLVALRGGEERTIEWHVRSIHGTGMRFVVGRDVTDRVARSQHVRRLLTELQDSRNHERKRVAGELHDLVLQHLIVAMMHLERPDSGAADGSGQASLQADRFVREAASSLRDIIDGIQPFGIEHLSTAAALERCVADIEVAYGIAIDHDISLQRALDTDRSLLCFRLAGEALRNAAKHAGAANVVLRAGEADDRVALRVSDDGVGFAEALHVHGTLTPRLGTGFNLLLEEMLATGGSFAIDSDPGEGTTVRASWPLPR